ncbi:MAG: hypothetical protein F4Y07_05085 [Gemmatimonadetes bacterium]|nr:hypothetical protein [Gemmatimonadota bacterium]
MAEDNTSPIDITLPYEIKVNGVQIILDHRTPSAREILVLAQKAGAVPGKPDEYLLQGEKRIYQLDETIDVAEDGLFITIPNKPTPVARSATMLHPPGH